MNLSASLYAANPMRLEQQIAAVAPFVASLHVDVMDGVFAPAFGYGERLVQEIASRYDIAIDVHLMVAEPGRWVRGFAAAGARRIAFHIEASDDPRWIAAAIRDGGALAYVALLPDTPITTAQAVHDAVDGVLLLTAPPGGGRFSAAALARANALPAGTPVIVDGAIEPQHIDILRRAPVELVVMGRALFQADDAAAKAQDLATLLKSDSRM